MLPLDAERREEAALRAPTSPIETFGKTCKSALADIRTPVRGSILGRAEQ
jgi:hypothetical protein